MPPKIQRTNPAFFAARPAAEGKAPAAGASPVNALVGVPENAAQILHLGVDLIIDNPHQTRRHFDPAELESLRSSIARHGLQQPIGVRKLEDGRYQLVFGERRLRSVRALGQRTVACVVVPADVDDAEVTVIENLLRADLTPFEHADALATLKERHHYSHAELGRLVGMDKGDVSRMLSLRSLPVAIREAYDTLAHKPARYKLWKLAALQDPAERDALWRRLVAEATPVEEGGEGRPRRSAPPLPPSSFAPPVARGLLRTSEALKTFSEAPKPLEEADRAVLQAMREAIDAILGADRR
ncbi:ParB/RepB/Spo0J family partition protein [Azospirillum thermophilum]|uniref:Chromosome partitioning protein (Modular protein) n=1 Tax=Azospirillum thermophilum TaxID=2202148 RepID=A0A2S2CV23_9PROT|nr:ParB/RepB/Spo0J family partition protein [Azospirillum thermophilum]AWK88319.1 chromosome partitioning protein (modular protein) [Azospirillum thermophilum]